MIELLVVMEEGMLEEMAHMKVKRMMSHLMRKRVSVEVEVVVVVV